MAGVISVTISRQQEKDLANLLAGVRDGVRRAMAGAINKTVDKTATRIRKRVAAGLAMPVKVIRPLIKPIKTSAKSDRIEGKIRLLNFNIALAKARAKRAPGGGSYALSRIGDPKSLPHPSFKGNTRQRARRVLCPPRREGKADQGDGTPRRVIKRGPRKGQPILRQKIFELHAPSPRKFFETAPGRRTRGVVRDRPRTPKATR
jgi:hypothetical protein